MGLKFLTATALAALITVPAMAQDNYPDRPIDLIVAFSPGGGTDVAARAIQPYIEAELGMTITVVNTPGAGGEIGFTELAESDPDGYTIGFINLPAMFAYSFERDTRYDVNSFTPIANLVTDPGIWAVRSDSEFETLQDVIDFAVENPGALPIGTTGSVGSSEHLALLVVQQETGATFSHVPFGSTAPMRTALLGGHIPLGAFNLSEGIEFAEEGQLRILGVMSSERSPMAPDIPTFTEQGIEVLGGSSRGIAGPAGLSDEVIETLSAAIGAALENPEYAAAAEAANIPLNYMPAPEYAAFLTSTDADLAVVWSETPWRQ